MKLLFNDLSLHGQFQSVRDFEESIRLVMEMRAIARRFGRELHCPINVVNAPCVVGDMPMQQAISFLGKDAQSALRAWLTREGPFMEDTRQHRSGDRLYCGDEEVTNTAVGEAAYCIRFHDEDHHLVSLSPSTWNFSPVPVVWRKSRGRSFPLDIENYWEREALQRALEDVAPPTPPMGEWPDMEEKARKQYAALTFSDDAFEPIRLYPFKESAAKRIIEILGVLHDLKRSFDAQGKLTDDGQDIYRKHFVGDKAWFSDSSDREKAQFRQELTFPNPLQRGERLFCPMHGKVKSDVPIRVHYHWNISADEPVYVMYVGSKITTR